MNVQALHALLKPSDSFLLHGFVPEPCMEVDPHQGPKPDGYRQENNVPQFGNALTLASEYISLWKAETCMTVS